MDVRCEKCQTEYELDESKLKPGGVTVKCTSCGHMFKVRGQQPQGEVAIVPPPRPITDRESARPATERGNPRPATDRGSPRPITDRGTPTPTPNVVVRASSVLSDTDDGERTWLIRLEDGEIKTCRELSTLQKWIVSGRVSRSCSISRTGKKWKLLGEIGELASFFGIADEAREARVSGGRWAAGGDRATREYPSPPGPDGSFAIQGSPSHPRTVPRRPSSEQSPLRRIPDTPVTGANESAVAAAYGAEERSVNARSAEPSYADALAAEMAGVSAKDVAADSSAEGPFDRTLPVAEGFEPSEHGASGTPAGSHDPTNREAQTPAGGELAKQGGDTGRSGDATDLSATVTELEDTPPSAQAHAFGRASTPPPYGTGLLGGPAPAVRAKPTGLPLAPPPARPVGSAAAGTPAGPTTAGWAARGHVTGMRDHGPSGPTAGVARGGHMAEAAFVGGSRMPNVRGEFESEKFAPMPFTDDEPLIPPRNRAGLWVMLISLVLMAGAACAVYFILFAGPAEEKPVPVAAAPVASAAPAPTGTPTAAPTAAPSPSPPAAPLPNPPPTPMAEMEKAVADAGASILADTDAALDPLAQKLSALASGAGGGTAVNPAFLVARARVEAALAQHLADRAKLAPAAESKKLTEESRARARTVHELAAQALSLQPEDAGALLAMADARRLEGDRTIEVERGVRRARRKQAAAELTREADLVVALLRVRDNRLRDARVLLDKLAKTTPAEDVRPRFRLAWIDYLDGNAEAARSGAEAVLKVHADHAGARALLDNISTAATRPPVASGDEVPAGERGQKPGAGKPGDKVASGEGEDLPAGGDSFDAVLARADKLSENGNCAGAMPLYRKVLDMHPASVEALTGLGYCHLDRREFASAHARFRAALGISSRYQPAMWGIAEAYQQQGLKPQALERFEAFIAEHPNSTRSEAARIRIDTLRRELGTAGTGEGIGSPGGTSTNGGDSSGSGSSGGASGTGGTSPGGETPPASGSNGSAGGGSNGSAGGGGSNSAGGSSNSAGGDNGSAGGDNGSAGGDNGSAGGGNGSAGGGNGSAGGGNGSAGGGGSAGAGSGSAGGGNGSAGGGGSAGAGSGEGPVDGPADLP